MSDEDLINLEEWLADLYSSDEPDPFKVAAGAGVPEALRSELLIAGVVASHFALCVGEDARRFLTDAYIRHENTKKKIQERLDAITLGGCYGCGEPAAGLQAREGWQAGEPDVPVPLCNVCVNLAPEELAARRRQRLGGDA